MPQKTQIHILNFKNFLSFTFIRNFTCIRNSRVLTKTLQYVSTICTVQLCTECTPTSYICTITLEFRREELRWSLKCKWCCMVLLCRGNSTWVTEYKQQTVPHLGEILHEFVIPFLLFLHSFPSFGFILLF